MAEFRCSLRVLLLPLALAVLPAAFAQEAPESKFKLSGFLSIVGGRVIGSDLGADYVGPPAIDENNCPCYTADWGNAGVYRQRWSLAPESRAGIQGKYTVSSELNFVGQLVLRGSDPKPRVQWAYASYSPSKNLEFQFGRKRIPLYYYSDFQDIGSAYPWVTPPPELYGWEATNYNGASLRFKQAVGEANLTASMFAGKETVKDSLYMQLYYDGKTKVTWSKLIGGDLELTRGPLTLRAVYMQSTVLTTNPTIELDDRAKLKAYGLAVNLDLEDWFVLSEITQLTRQFDAGYRVTAPAMTIGAGYHYGNWTPFLNFARYTERTDDPEVYAPQSFRRLSFTLRYDIDARSGVKGQIDKARDVTRNFGGDTTVLRVSYDRLF